MLHIVAAFEIVNDFEREALIGDEIKNGSFNIDFVHKSSVIDQTALNIGDDGTEIFWRGVAINVESDGNTAAWQAVVIFNNARGKFVVGNDDVIALKRGNFGGAEANFLDGALNIVKNDIVAYRERTIDVNGKKSEHVFEDRLQTKGGDDTGDAQTAEEGAGVDGRKLQKDEDSDDPENDETGDIGKIGDGFDGFFGNIGLAHKVELNAIGDEIADDVDENDDENKNAERVENVDQFLWPSETKTGEKNADEKNDGIMEVARDFEPDFKTAVLQFVLKLGNEKFGEAAGAGEKR